MADSSCGAGAIAAAYTQLLERAEQAESLSFKLLQTAPDALIALDAAHTVRFVNDTACAAFHRKCEELVDKPLAEVWPELDERLQRETATSSDVSADIKIGEHVFSPTLRLRPVPSLSASSSRCATSPNDGAWTPAVSISIRSSHTTFARLFMR